MSDLRPEKFDIFERFFEKNSIENSNFVEERYISDLKDTEQVNKF